MLAKIKPDQDLKLIPAFVHTILQAESELIQTYIQHANCYIVKPVNLDDFINVMKSIKGFWQQIVKLPPTGEE